MKVLMVSTDLKLLEDNSAVRIRHVEYAKDFEKLDIIVFSKNVGKKEIQVGENLTLYPTNSYNKLFCVRDAINIGKKILTANPQLQTANWLITVQDPFLTAIVGVSLKSKFSLPLEVQVHTDIGSSYFKNENFSNKIRFMLAKRNLPKANSVRVVSKRIKEFLVHSPGFMIHDSKIVVKPIMIDMQNIKDSPLIVDLHKKYYKFRKNILMASRLTNEKGFGTALKTFAEIIKSHPNTGLVIVGSGPLLSRLKSQVSRLKLDGHVFFEEWVSQNKLFSYYKTTDVFLSTSLYEGYGLSMVEAHTAGCEIVATDAGIASELTNNICPVGDYKCLADSVIKILNINHIAK